MKSLLEHSTYRGSGWLSAAIQARAREAEYRSWRSRVESFKTTAGARPVLEHVAECVWAEHFAANDDACDAVVAELTKVD